MLKSEKYLGIILLGLLIFTGCGIRNNELEDMFVNPPSSAKPRTWMHAMSGNMSKEGMTKDLESIAEVGIGGILLFNVSQGIPNGPVKYNSDFHHEIIQHAARECERLRLSFGVHNCDGWSSSGGPWIAPEQSMKMVVWHDTILQGNRDLKVQLPQPTIREGFYKDIAVIAYPSLKSELEDHRNQPVITASDKRFDLSLVADNRIDNQATISKSGNENPWIQYDFGKPHTIRSVYMVFTDRNGEAVLQTSSDGRKFTTVRENLFKVRTGKGEWDIVDHFEPVTARYFRLLLDETMTIREARLMSTYPVQNFLGRSSLARTDDARLAPIGTPEEDMIIRKEDIVNLTDKIDKNGILFTNLSEGNWTIIRFGYTSTGAFNHPASDEGRGLECDKFSKEAFKIHYDAFVKKVIEHTKEDAPNAMQYVEIDSYEMGGQNWTDGFQDIFQDKKGYEIQSFLPLFAGRFVESADASDAVFWDLREVYCHLMTENYYGYFTELCHQDGVNTYIEPYGNGPINNLEAGGKADMVMGEFWMNRPLTQVASAISSGHIYGKEIVSAESFTSTPEINWMGNPGMAKLSGDRAWTAGINEFMFHRFVHQANTHVKPGLTMNRWGFHFDRTQTWWKNAGEDWFKYIARGSYLLRQGVPVSDLLVFIGDGSPNSTFSREDFDPAIPQGTNFDCVNADVLINRIHLEDGRMVLPEGTAYQILVLKNCEKLSLKTLKRIHEIALAGIPVVGLQAIQQAGYLRRKEQLETFDRLVEEIENQAKTYSDFNWPVVFKEVGLKPDFLIEGREDINFIHRKTFGADIYFFYNPDSVARSFECIFRVDEKIPEDWNAMKGKTTKLGRFSHENGLCRTWIELEAEESSFIIFRESSKGVPSVGTLGNGTMATEYVLNEKNELILKADENGTYQATLNSGDDFETLVEDLPEPLAINGSWEVEFLKENDYEAIHDFYRLTDWKDNAEENIMYYSGTAVYRKQFDFPKDLAENADRFILDLGEVNIVAEVRLNGQDMGVYWISPFRLDVTDAIIAGENHLEIAITNQWTNRLIGDERFPRLEEGFELEGNYPQAIMPDWYINNEPIPAGPRTTFCSAGFYSAGDELMPSGLRGPVLVHFRKNIYFNPH